MEIEHREESLQMLDSLAGGRDFLELDAKYLSFVYPHLRMLTDSGCYTVILVDLHNNSGTLEMLSIA